MAENSLINGTIRILLVEDSESDTRLIKEFLKEEGIDHVLYVVEDGVEALKFVHTHCKPDAHYCPDIIMLDLNLPKMSGVEVLKEMKKDNNLKRIPVIILTTSDAQEDIDECCKNHADCYLVKPADLSDFETVINSIKEYWFKTVKLP